MTPPDLLAFPGLTPRERKVVEMRIRDGLRAHIIAMRLGITLANVREALATARKRAAGTMKPSTGRATNAQAMVMDADWFPRQVAYVRQIAADPDHQTRYLRGIAICWGQEWADKVEAAANG